MIKINNKQKALVLFLGLAALLLPTAAWAQAYDKEAAESYNGGAFYELIAYDTYLDELANVLKAVELNNRSGDWGFTVNTQDFGTPLGSGVGILLAAGAGYAALRRKRSRKNTTLLLACVLLLGFTQCKKEQPQSGEKVYITVKVNNGASTGSATDGAKADVNPADGKITFSEGDVLFVGSDGVDVGVLVYSGDAFSGSLTSPTLGEPLYFYFLGGNLRAIIIGTTHTVNISDQTGSSYPVISMGVSDQNYSGEGSYSTTLLNQCSLIKFSVDTPSNLPIHITGMKNKVTIDFENNNIVYDKEGAGVIKMRAKNGDNYTWAIVLPQDALEEGDEGTAYTFGYKGRRPALPAIGLNEYIGISTAVSMEVTTEDVSRTLDLQDVNEDITIGSIGDCWTVTGTLSSDYKISIADGATVAFDNVTINYGGTDGAAITCLGDATIMLSGTNTLSVPGGAIYYDTPEPHYEPICGYPAILVAGIGTKLTVTGSGILTAIGGYAAAGIGCKNASYTSSGMETGYSCGIIQIDGGTINAYSGCVSTPGDGEETGIGSVAGGEGVNFCEGIIINGGTVTAKGGCAGIGSSAQPAGVNFIAINGGTVTATGGRGSAGIGTGPGGICGPITISNTVTRVTATKGEDAPNSIGAGADLNSEMYPPSGLPSVCEPVTIGGTVYWDGTDYQNGGASYLTTSPFVYPAGPVGPPSGALNGLFTVNDSGGQVYFSQGNLQYQASSGTWRFAENQWNLIGANYGNTTLDDERETQSAWIDLFGWGTASNPWKADGSGYNEWHDWGNNAISNGGNTVNQWRTLTHDEWGYLLGRDDEEGHRSDSKRFMLATISASGNYYSGLIIFPDGFAGVGSYSYNDPYSMESVTEEHWATMASAGAVFLPFAGRRLITYVDYAWNQVISGEAAYGYYWASDYEDSPIPEAAPDPYCLKIIWSGYSSNYSIGIGSASTGHSVRLVKDAN